MSLPTYIKILLTLSCTVGSSSIQAMTIFAQDNRRSITSSAYPYNLIGKVQYTHGGTCTGSLVGEDLVLTSAHCFTTTSQLQLSDISFQLHQKGTSQVKEVILGTPFPTHNREADWAILRLKTPLGRTYGYFGLQVIKANTKAPFLVSLPGYSLDHMQGSFNLSAHVNCQVQYAYGHILRHDCDATSGASGGPLLAYFVDGSYRIIGIHAASPRCFEKNKKESRCPDGLDYTHDQANYGIDANSFINVIINLRNKRASR